MFRTLTPLVHDLVSCPVPIDRDYPPFVARQEQADPPRPDQSVRPSRISSAARCFSAMSERRARVAALGMGGAVNEFGRIQPWHTGTSAMYRLPTPTPPRL